MNALTPILDWFRPPVFNSLEKTQRAEFLNYVLLAVAVLSFSLTAIANAIVNVMNSINALPALLLGTGALLLRIPLRKGKIKTTAWVSITFLCAQLAYISYFSGGVRGVAFLTFMVIIFITTVVLNMRSGIIVLCITVGWGSYLAMLEQGGQLPVAQGHSISDARVYLITVVAIFVLMILLAITVQSNFTKLIENRVNTERLQREKGRLELQSSELNFLVQQQTQEILASLEREQALGRKLEEALEQEAAVSRLKSHIIDTVSHEFRTPLTVISSSVDLLTRHGQRLTDAKRDRLSIRIRQAILYLTNLLQDVVLVDSVQSAELRVHAQLIHPRKLVQTLEHDLFLESRKPANLSFTNDIEANQDIAIDFSLIKQAAHNLIVNALTYSDPTEPIVVSIMIRPTHLTISVKDSGIGIPAEDIDKIWDLFYRAGNVETRRGLGLGLYIVRQLMDVMDGTVTAASAGANKGSTFTLDVPLSIPQRASLSPMRHSPVYEVVPD